MVRGAKTPQLHLFSILDLLGIAVPPFHRHIAVCICIHQYIERAVTFQLGQESDRGCDLSEDGLDLGLNLCVGLLWRWGMGIGPISCQNLMRTHIEQSIWDRRHILRCSILLIHRLRLAPFLRGLIEDLYIKLPPLDMLARIFTCNDHN